MGNEEQSVGIEKQVRETLMALGEDPNREGLLKTPERVSKAMGFLTSGYNMDLKTIVNDAVFSDVNRGMIIARDIEVYSLCEHHMLPFYGRAHIGYIPDKKIIGLSKLPRIVDMFARRLQVQERLTEQLVNAINEVLEPQGVGVVIKCRHMCMMMRGVEKQNSEVFTSSMAGVFSTNEGTRIEFLDLIRTGSK
ncbi:MAG: GTP cyclohydrolase I FolE [Spirochaetia bacterium]|nr:GTP cyclohydrolase I FolE [Spirochaetia bacterium]